MRKWSNVNSKASARTLEREIQCQVELRFLHYEFNFHAQKYLNKIKKIDGFNKIYTG